MNDTPKHISAYQLKVWLDKTPAERLHQMLTDNEAIYTFWTAAKQNNKQLVKK